MQSTVYPLPPMRSQLPTLPQDLREYARLNTGPESWSASEPAPPWRESESEPPREAVEELEPEDAPLRFVAGSLIEVSDGDVPRVVAELLDIGAIEAREREVLAVVDGTRTLGSILRAWTLGGGVESELVDVLCALCARGVVAFSGSRDG